MTHPQPLDILDAEAHTTYMRLTDTTHAEKRMILLAHEAEIETAFEMERMVRWANQDAARIDRNLRWTV